MLENVRISQNPDEFAGVYFHNSLNKHLHRTSMAITVPWVILVIFSKVQSIIVNTTTIQPQPQYLQHWGSLGYL